MMKKEDPIVISDAAFGTWISVSEALPEFNVGVLIATEDGDVTAASRLSVTPYIDRKKGVPGDVYYNPCDPTSWTNFENKNWIWEGHLIGGYEWNWEFDERNITHWMPLPAPPAETKH